MREACLARRVRVGLVLALGLCSARSANAWYYPEHAELTRLALRDFAPPFVTRVIESALADARDLQMQVCPEATTPLNKVTAHWDSVECVPYGALAALAADHSANTLELAEELQRKMDRNWPVPDVIPALILTEAAQSVWSSFQCAAPPEAVRVWTMSISRLEHSLARLPSAAGPRDYVRQLDAELALIDTGYVTRAKNAMAHFHDPTVGLSKAAQQAALGSVDNALGQLLAHHARSLQLAVLSRRAHDPGVQRALRAEALLEHAFALHFFEDGLAAGHIATDPAITDGDSRAQRHDFFNRQGLAVTRALSNTRCEVQHKNVHGDLGLPVCWTAHGDGFAAAQDRIFVEEAAARLQVAFAIALSGPNWELYDAEQASGACRKWLDDSGPIRSPCQLAMTATLLDPDPTWTEHESAEPELSDVEWATDVIGHFEQDLQRLALEPGLVPANAALARSQLGVLSERVLALHALFRPLLVAWPEAVADVTTLAGADQFGHGLNGQLLAGLGGSFSAPVTDNAAFTAWGGVGLGLAYTAQGIFPHRRARALAELNAGVAEGLMLAGQGPRFRSLAIAELRLPVTTGILYAAGAYGNTRKSLMAVGQTLSFGILGGRGYFAIDGNKPLFTGWDLEILSLLLGGSGEVTLAARSGLLDPELRMRAGWRAKDAAEPLHELFDGFFVVTMEANGGYFF